MSTKVKGDGMNDKSNGGVKETAPRGRLAPSPTGSLHLGNARSFLLAWLSIRSQGGTLVLRMEDLDHPKVKPGAAAEALDDLRWLGIDWDEGPDIGGPGSPYVQSMRRAHYRVALDRLNQMGLVYPCVCSRGDVEEAQSAPHPGNAHTLKYPGTCRGRFDAWADAVMTLPEGRLPVWRFKVEDEVSSFEDGFRGLQRLNLAEATGDFAMARDPDGAGYMLAVVVDDDAMGITEVVRGDDLLDATHCQLAIQKALGLSAPRYFHVPLVVAQDGRRLAKRHGDTRISALRKGGVSPQSIIGLLAYWCGWADFGEALSAQDVLGRFDLNTLRREPAVLNNEVKGLLGL